MIKKLFPAMLAALLVLPLQMQASTLKAKHKKQFALQLYSIRELVHEGDKADFQKLLNELSAMGYTAVEAASYDQGKGTIYGFTPEDYKAAVEAAGMESLSAHIGKPLSDEELNSGDYSQSLAWWDKTIADQKKAGVSYIVMPWMNIPSTLKQLKVYCDYYNEVGKKCAAQGIKFGYHNHKHEFVNVEGQMAYFRTPFQNTFSSRLTFTGAFVPTTIPLIISGNTPDASNFSMSRTRMSLAEAALWDLT